MQPDLLEWLACPRDGAYPLRADPGAGKRLTCPQCGRAYPVIDGIPSLLPDPAEIDPQEAQAKEAERSQRDREAGIYDANRLLRFLSVFEIPLTLARLQPPAGDTVLEVGCGTGRFTKQLTRRGSRVVALDHSIDSLRRARERVGDGALFVQADASYLPVRSGWAARTLSCQMLEHLPTPASRERAVEEMARALRPGGRLVLSAYWHQPALRGFVPKEGRHSGEIYFYRFDKGEFAAMLGKHVELRGLTGRLIYILLAHGVKTA